MVDERVPKSEPSMKTRASRSLSGSLSELLSRDSLFSSISNSPSEGSSDAKVDSKAAAAKFTFGQGVPSGALLMASVSYTHLTLPTKRIV